MFRLLVSFYYQNGLAENSLTFLSSSERESVSVSLSHLFFLLSEAMFMNTLKEKKWGKYIDYPNKCKIVQTILGMIMILLLTESILKAF